MKKSCLLVFLILIAILLISSGLAGCGGVAEDALTEDALAEAGATRESSIGSAETPESSVVGSTTVSEAAPADKTGAEASPSAVAAVEGDFPSDAGLEFVEETADDKEWADIQAIIRNYEETYVQAVSKGEFKLVEPYITPGSEFYSQQENLVSKLFRQGVREELTEYSLEKTESLDGGYRAYVVEQIEVSSPGKAKKTNEYVWIYNIDKTAAGLKIGAIAKWADYNDYVEMQMGRVKTDGYYIDDFANYYGSLLTDAVNSLYVGSLKKYSDTAAVLEQQKQLIRDMRALGVNFELIQYQNLDSVYNEKDRTGESFNRYIFQYQSKEKRQATLDLKIRFSLEEVWSGYYGYANILNMKIESFDSVRIPDSGPAPESFLPKGWKLLEQAEGDLDKDGLADIAAVIQEDREWEMSDYGNAPERILLLLLKQKDGSLRLTASSGKAVLRADEGGVFGDPFEDIAIENGVLRLGFYGGSNYRWGRTYRFRNQDNGWFLIGATVLDLFTGTGEYTQADYNLSTGKEIITKGIEGGKSTTKNLNRGKKPLVNLMDFEAATVSESVF